MELLGVAVKSFKGNLSYAPGLLPSEKDMSQKQVKIFMVIGCLNILLLGVADSL